MLNKLLYIFMLFGNINAFIHNFSLLEGNWILRSTNDLKFKEKYVYLVLKSYNDLKIKSISNGIVRKKISRSAYLILKKNNNPLFKFYNLSRYYNFDEDNNIDFELIINKYNTYSYSLFGLEIPQIKYNQIINYNVKLNINVKHKGNTLFIKNLDNELYYIFDLTTNVKPLLPYIEISITTFLVSKILDIMISSLIK